MRLEEAIEIMEKEEENTWMGNERKWKQAVKISYKAMQAIKDFRKGLVVDFLLPLPGETKEEMKLEKRVRELCPQCGANIENWKEVFGEEHECIRHPGSRRT